MDSAATPHPVVDVISRLVRDTNQMWAEGVVDQRSAVRLVEPDLVATQYATHFTDGVWTAGSGAEWLDGTEEAARALKGRGCVWSAQDLHVLPRGDDEAIASYRIVHHWGDGDREPSQAFFLETWRRGDDGQWRLSRHTAEKV
jgi:ketosteroid isomerase-like protein